MKNDEKSTKTIGDFGEKKAAEYLQKNGFRIVERQYRYKKCEIDIIAEDKEFLAFVEVKTRSSAGPGCGGFGRPARAVTQDKQRHLLCAAYDFLRKRPSVKQPRMDVIEVYIQLQDNGKIEVNQIIHIRNAFGRT